jgi:hypothetical protein
MLRLNIRCLNNQARFEPRGLREATKGRKDRERKNKREQDGGVKAARMLVFARSRVRETKRERERGERGRERERENAVLVSKDEPGRKRERERERGRGGGGDSGSDRVGIEHVLRRSSFSIRASSSLSAPPPHATPPHPTPPPTSRALGRPACRIALPVALARQVYRYTYYAKRVTVGGLGSQTRTV